ncbi:hypothetical protein Godav_029623 [Gossypium davidsonii]|uniref:Uncharacterized protein n=1 Tax=Gossypium davidsonii TaxID=34287 RepID=A0A7J8TBF5_GOSDV|nr:hypothetical protein [Gossypium davidsonii]
MKKLAIRTNAGKAKVCETLIGISGAMIFTFCKAIDINILSTNVNLLKHHHQQCGVPLLVFKHCFDVFDGINTRSFACSLYCEGLELMEAWVEL